MLTTERIDAIFTEMEKYVIDLIPNPTSLGPQYFRDQIANCRNHLNRVSLVASELDRERLAISSELMRAEASFALEHDNLLANDQRVKSLGNIEDRKATVGYILRDRRLEINGLKDRLHAAEAVYKVVMLRNRDLTATMTAIKDQKKAMQSEIRNGAFYGDERVPEFPAEAEVSPEELARLLSDEEAELETSQVLEPPAEMSEAEELAAVEGLVAEFYVHEDSGEEEAVQRFLAKDQSPAEKDDSDDFSSLLEGL